ncbi:MAG: chitobiase/beta-hexosaminidase C-terminal domain-containing protein [Candidatus Cryptobacteroides sp.]|nr:chitobiase/beta-hexosaminidase C-terminal domain-containing protein [Bacteroidales bacterium]MDY2774094.1 chitobiase/beta-hexosaminidase C-terminal domain-containing protein [Candidatus Cryptobacteroides sp.]
MKNTIKTAAVIALSLFAAACAKETKIESPDEGQKLHFTVNTAENAVVKSFLENNNDGTYTPKWSKGDELAIFMGTISDKTKPSGVLSNTNETGPVAKFVGTVAAVEGTTSFKSFAPASAFAKGYGSGNVGITLSENQEPSSLTIDQSCDILVAKEASYTADAANNVVVNDLFFKRVFSVVKIALTGPAALSGEKVQKFSLTAPEGTVLAGRAAIDLSTAAINKWNISKNAVTATYTTDAPVFGSDTPGSSNVVWLVVNPGTIASGAKLTFSGETAAYTFSKEVTLSNDLIFPESQLAVINLTLADEHCTKKTTPSVVPVYASVAELIAAGTPTTAGTKVTVTLTDEEIIRFHTLKDGTVAGAIIKVGTQEVEIFCKGTPSNWKVGGTISGTLTNCDWKLYNNSTWELCPADYSELTYKAPLAACATPVISIAEDGAVSITCETAGATIHYTVGENPADPTEADAVFGTVKLTEGQTIKAIAVAEGFKPSAIASKKYVVGGAATPVVLYTLTPTNGENNSYADNCDVTVTGITWNLTGNSKVNPWRLGGKNITNVDRALYSKTAYPKALTSIKVTFGTAKDITINSCKLVYSTNADFTDSKECNITFTASSTAEVTENFPANAYYKLVFNVTNTKKDKNGKYVNGYVQLSKIEFLGLNN